MVCFFVVVVEAERLGRSGMSSKASVFGQLWIYLAFLVTRPPASADQALPGMAR